MAINFMTAKISAGLCSSSDASLGSNISAGLCSSSDASLSPCLSAGLGAALSAGLCGSGVLGVSI